MNIHLTNGSPAEKLILVQPKCLRTHVGSVLNDKILYEDISKRRKFKESGILQFYCQLFHEKRSTLTNVR